jgi:hypothetical protein
MAPEPDGLQEARRQVEALEGVLRRSGWYGHASLQDAQYQWAATGLSVEAIEAYLAAGIADPRVAAEFCFELGISAKQIQLAGIGEQVSIGSMSVEDAVTAVLGPRAAGGLDQYRAALHQEAAGDLGSVLKEGSRWWQARIQRLAGFLDDQPVPSEQVGWLSQQSDHDGPIRGRSTGCGVARRPTGSGWPARPAAHQAGEALTVIPPESSRQTLISAEQSPA